jgi:hypothetical protein
MSPQIKYAIRTFIGGISAPRVSSLASGAVNSLSFLYDEKTQLFQWRN